MEDNHPTAKKKQLFFGFIERNMRDHVNAYAAQAAYFMILSFIPFILFLTTMIRYTDLTYNMLSDGIRTVIPANLQDFVLQLVSEVYNRNTAIMPVSLLMALWSAGKAIQSLINGLNTVYHVTETRNWLINRIYAVFYTALFGIALVGSFALLVVGTRIEKILVRNLPIMRYVFIGGRSLVVLTGLFLIFLFLYQVLPNRKVSLKSQAPGAFLVAVSWTIFSDLFSLYFKLFPEMFSMYGSLTAMIIMMIWLYFCMTFVMIGAEINAYFKKELRFAGRWMSIQLKEKKKKHSEGK